MNRFPVSLTALLLCFALLLSACGAAVEEEAPAEEETAPGQIYLYGELHASPKHFEIELKLWQELYAGGVRHHFVEFPYYTSQYLNMWMQSDSDEILDQLFEDWSGTMSDNAYYRDFLIQIKQTCPETVFHGTDVGHQYATTGARYLSYLEEQGLTDTEEYALTLEAIAQGEIFYNGDGDDDHVYRENMMVENFIREYSAIYGKTIMGIYGNGHTDPEGLTSWAAEEIPCMANQLTEVYGDDLICHTILALIKSGA